MWIEAIVLAFGLSRVCVGKLVSPGLLVGLLVELTQE